MFENDAHHDLLHALEQGAVPAGAEISREMGEEQIDLLETLRPVEERRPADAPDLTLGGYIGLHDRPPAFEGSDGQPYTVGVETQATGDPARAWAAFLVFVRWAATGAGIMAHVESGDVAFGSTEEEAAESALQLSLYEVKAELDAAIARLRQELED
ncbi:MAG: hypothetical protein HY703_05710 [Gemmatimonadetes bacterium]|nr:hypothetical protein [Gemmatimonadota bacterium]